MEWEGDNEHLARYAYSQIVELTRALTPHKGLIDERTITVENTRTSRDVRAKNILLRPS